MATITLTNDFHNTEARVREGVLTPRTVKRVHDQLCGIGGCTCGNDQLGTRGPQRDADGNRIAIDDCSEDGRVEVRVEQ